MNNFGYNWSIVQYMFRKELKICGALAGLAAIYFLILSGCSTSKGDSTNASPAVAAPPLAAHLVPGRDDGRIAYVTARLMEEFHYSQEPLDTEMSKKFFDQYIDSLDPRHENFLQSDLADFAHYRTNLDTYTIGGRGSSDLTPAYDIYSRFLERMNEHVAYVEELLSQDKFKFTGADRFELDRRHAPFPKDLDAARELWRQRLRYEYLQEKLGDELGSTNGEVTPLTKTNLADINETLTRHYAWAFRLYTNWDNTDVLQAYLNGLTHSYDPHSDYLNPEHAQDFSIQMSLSLYGIGAKLVEDDGYCTIDELIPGGPAAQSKQLNPRDRIVAVAQGKKAPVDVVGMDLGKVVQLIRGAKGTEVRLTVSPVQDRAARKVVALTREEIKLENSEAKAALIERPDGHGGTNRIGLIDLPSFYATIDVTGNAGHTIKSTTADVTKLIQKLEREKAAGLVIDLRNNGGGSLEEAIKFVGLFIKSGPVVQGRSPDGTVTVDSDTDSNMLYSGPLVVLVNHFSASASEIAAGALQDYGRALIVGDTSTFGKGTVQNLNSLAPFVSLTSRSTTNDPGTVKITIRKFYRVSGASTQLKGVIPNIILPDTLNASPDVGESALPNALPWDTIPAADYEKMNLVRPYLVDLSKRSATRVAADPEFGYIVQDIAEIQKLNADRTATLNEKEAIKERQRIIAQNKARDEERETRPEPPEKVYEITVENADKPGLTLEFAPDDTNSVTVTGTNAAPAATEKKSSPPVDPMLNETENILEDYISMTATNEPVLAHKL
ncbi:MAG TPA: carboxy terminal-processing peptidase [Verrucomicrobiae bacterium]|nr:carboxy terminal-processing peptidase [Verrucomicrobiae bacterium]